MKKLFTLFLILIYNSLFATTYYVDSKNGDDGNEGTSPANAWRTIGKVNGASLSPGDAVLFKRNEVFRGKLIPKSGDTKNEVTYSAYGTGNKPLLLGSENKSQLSDWVNDRGNIWRCTTKFTVDIGNLIFNNEASVGWKKWTEVDLTSQGDYWYDNTNGYLKMYSTTNPGSFYSNIELALTFRMVDFSKTSYINFNNLDFRYIAGPCFFGHTANNITIQDCDMSYIGGGKQNTPKGNVRFGNAVVVWKSGHDIIVERCTFDQMYDAAITLQGTNDTVWNAYNIYFRNNIINRSEYSFEIFLRNPETVVTDVYFENNTCTNAGGGWAHAQRPKPNGAHVMIGNSDAKISNVYIRNNIFDEATEYSVRFYQKEATAWYILDYNCYYQSSGDVARIYGTYYDYKTQWKNYQAASGQDTHSVAADPMLRSDHSLQENSPCIDVGLNVPTVKEDFNRESRPQN